MALTHGFMKNLLYFGLKFAQVVNKLVVFNMH
jgi:hypothetical protein